jgi:hypothetical protein
MSTSLIILALVVAVAFWFFDACVVADRPFGRDIMDETRASEVAMLGDK